MRSSRLVRVALLAFLFSSSTFIRAVAPSWARKATAFPGQCWVLSATPATSPRDVRESRRVSKACRPIHIPSPDGRFTVEIRYEKRSVGEEDDLLVAGLQLCDQEGSVRDLDLPYSFQINDLLWSPDSKAFFVNGGNESATSGFWIYVYRVDDPELKPLNVTKQAQRDMVTSFPPCRASELDERFCHEWEKEPENT